VAYITEESCFSAVNLSQGFETFSLLFCAAGILDGGGNLARNQFEKGPVFCVELAGGADSSDQNSGAPVLRPSGYRKNDRF
jgi:hypothetical protein